MNRVRSRNVYRLFKTGPAGAGWGACRPPAIAVRLFVMNKCRYCEKIRDEWDCHGEECRRAIAKAVRRQRAGLPMVPNVIRNDLPADATTRDVITHLSRQRLRARRGNEERRERKEAEDADGG
jgi:hypothetical protein